MSNDVLWNRTFVSPFLNQTCLHNNFSVIPQCPCNCMANVSCQCDDVPYFRRVSHHPLWRIEKNYVFPCLFIVGVIGNILNLVVLNTRGMRSKTNCFLSAMAVADLTFLLLRLPSNLLANSDASMSVGVIHFLIIIHPTMGFLMNAMSFASIWLAICVTVERLIAVHWPLHAKIYLEKARIIKCIVLIYMLGLLVHVFDAFGRVPVRKPVCDTRCLYEPDRVSWIWEVNEGVTHDLLNIIATFMTIFIPIGCLIVFNCLLIAALHRGRSEQVRKMSTDDTRCTNTALDDSIQRMRTTERKVTFTVLVIIFTFLLLNMPSGLLRILCPDMIICRDRPRWIYTCSNMLVTLAKATNFILYCLTSQCFRSRIWEVVSCQLDSVPSRSQKSSRRNTYPSNGSSRFHQSMVSLLHSRRYSNCLPHVLWGSQRSSLEVDDIHGSVPLRRNSGESGKKVMFVTRGRANSDGSLLTPQRARIVRVLSSVIEKNSPISRVDENSSNGKDLICHI